MDGSIALSASDRKALLQVYRSAFGLRSRRAQVILLAADGWSVRDLRRVTFASFDFITQTLRLYRQSGVDGTIQGESPHPLPSWAKRIADWVSDRTPEDFGYFRRRWSCETLAEVLVWETGVRASAETVRRVLRRLGYVWRRPRPTVGPVDPDHAANSQRFKSC